MTIKIGDKVMVSFGSGAEPRKAEVIDKMTSLTKVKVFYDDNGHEQSYEGWFQDKFIYKRKNTR